jgi:hypothetical protein
LDEIVDLAWGAAAGVVLQLAVGSGCTCAVAPIPLVLDRSVAVMVGVPWLAALAGVLVFVEGGAVVPVAGVLPVFVVGGVVGGVVRGVLGVVATLAGRDVVPAEAGCAAAAEADDAPAVGGAIACPPVPAADPAALVGGTIRVEPTACGVGGLPEELLPVTALLMLEPSWTNACRTGGTTARMTPMVNTARPVAKAGRSIASRQSRGRCRSWRLCLGACRARPGAGGAARRSGRVRSAPDHCQAAAHDRQAPADHR